MCDKAETAAPVKPLTETEDQACPAMGYQAVSICAPVEVKPFAKAGETITRCCGQPVVTGGDDNTCPGERNGACYFTITQRLCIEVPVAFGAKATVGDPYITCEGSSAEDICIDC